MNLFFFWKPWCRQWNHQLPFSKFSWTERGVVLCIFPETRRTSILLILVQVAWFLMRHIFCYCGNNNTHRCTYYASPKKTKTTRYNSRVLYFALLLIWKSTISLQWGLCISSGRPQSQNSCDAKMWEPTIYPFTQKRLIDIFPVKIYVR